MSSIFFMLNDLKQDSLPEATHDGTGSLELRPGLLLFTTSLAGTSDIVIRLLYTNILQYLPAYTKKKLFMPTRIPVYKQPNLLWSHKNKKDTFNSNSAAIETSHRLTTVGLNYSKRNVTWFLMTEICSQIPVP